MEIIYSKEFNKLKLPKFEEKIKAILKNEHHGFSTKVATYKTKWSTFKYIAYAEYHYESDVFDGQSTSNTHWVIYPIQYINNIQMTKVVLTSTSKPSGKIFTGRNFHIETESKHSKFMLINLL